MTDYRTDQKDTSPTHVEDALYPPLAKVDLRKEAARVTETYKNFVVFRINNHCVRLAVMQGEYRWHSHRTSDECFLVLEGELEIDVADDQTYHVRPGEAFTIPAGVVHRTRARTRTVNLCFEARDAYTDVVFEDHT